MIERWWSVRRCAGALVVAPDGSNSRNPSSLFAGVVLDHDQDPPGPSITLACVIDSINERVGTVRTHKLRVKTGKS
jgi:hypothetical protein